MICRLNYNIFNVNGYCHRVTIQLQLINIIIIIIIIIKGYISYVKYRDSILSDNLHCSMLRRLRVAAGEGAVAAIAVCRESGSTPFSSKYRAGVRFLSIVFKNDWISYPTAHVFVICTGTTLRSLEANPVCSRIKVKLYSFCDVCFLKFLVHFVTLDF